MRGTARHYNQHDRHDHTSIMSFLPLGPLPAMILGTFLLCYALVLACLLPMLSVSRDESSSLHVRGTVRRKFSGLDGAHLPQKADLFKAGSVVRQEFKTVKQEIKDIGGKVRQKLHPAYGQLIDEAVGEFTQYSLLEILNCIFDLVYIGWEILLNVTLKTLEDLIGSGS